MYVCRYRMCLRRDMEAWGVEVATRARQRGCEIRLTMVMATTETRALELTLQSWGGQEFSITTVVIDSSVEREGPELMLGCMSSFDFALLSDCFRQDGVGGAPVVLVWEVIDSLL
jgi:hypothetical protein